MENEKDNLKSAIKMPDDDKNKGKEYEKYVKAVTPTHSLWKNVIKAYIFGGLICVLGQIISNFADYMGLDKEMAAATTTLSLIFISIAFTGPGLYRWFSKHAGAGALVPITGFANSVASCAIEFKKEGQVFGIGCKIFTIAGPVILYGIFVSWLLGMVYWIMEVVL